MYAFIGSIGVFVLLASIIMALIQRKTRFKFWLITALFGFVLFVAALAATPEPRPDLNQLQVQDQTQNQTQTQGQSDTQEQAKAALNKLKTYLEENFGGSGNLKYATSWWNLIKTLKVSIALDGRAVVTVTTDIYPDKEGEDIGLDIANAVLNSSTVNVKSVTVLGKGERILAAKDK